MPIPVQTPLVEHTGNGVSTVFAFAFTILSVDDLKLRIDGTLTAAGFTISGVGDRAGGAITFSVAPAAGVSVLIYREVSLDRQIDYQENGDLLSATLDDDIDRVWMALQDQLVIAARTVRAQVGETLDELPDASSRASRVLGFDSIGQPTLLTRTDDGGSAMALDLLNVADATKGPAMVGLNATLNYAVATIGYRLRERVSVTDFPWLADATGVADSTAAIQAALDHASTNGLDVDAVGNFRADSSIYVRNGVRLEIGRRSMIVRTTASASTAPVIYAIDSFTELRGGQVMSNNASPGGVVCLGHIDAADDRNAWNWRFSDCRVFAQNNPGDIAVLVPSGQVAHPSRANYFGFITDISIYGGDIGLLLAEQANAHVIKGVQFWYQRSACLKLRGAYANHITGMFMHEGAAAGLIGVHIANKTASTQESKWNTVIGFTVETGGAGDRTFVIDSNCDQNMIIGGSNTSGGYTINNPGNVVMMSSQFVMPSMIGEAKVYADTSANALRILGRSSDNVANLQFTSQDGATTYGILQGRPSEFRLLANGAIPLTFYCNGAESFRSDTSNNLAAGADNARKCGTAALRWSEVFAGSATINTSDERAKEQIQDIDAAVLRAWAKVQYCQFKMRDAVQQKGAGARWHMGVIAQRVKEAFESEGLDAFAYGLLCYDEWEELAEPMHDDDGHALLDEQGQPQKRIVYAAGNRYGIRYEEALALECAYLRSKLEVA